MSDFTNSGERVEGASGLRIFFRSLRPREEPRAVVIIVPGFNAHSGYYEWVAEQLVATGLAVYAVDLRGHCVEELLIIDLLRNIRTGTS